jgi:hypothetical protein
MQHLKTLNIKIAKTEAARKSEVQIPSEGMTDAAILAKAKSANERLPDYKRYKDLKNDQKI